MERAYVVRADSSNYDPYLGLTHDCVLVNPDGHYRREHTYQRTDGSEPETKVYLDSLSDADLKALEAILDDGKLQDVTTPPPHGGIVKEIDQLSIRIPRPPKLQDLNFATAAERKPYEKTLRPFQDWFKKIQKRKIAEARGQAPTDCASPVQYFRITRTPAPNAGQTQVTK